MRHLTPIIFLGLLSLTYHGLAQQVILRADGLPEPMYLDVDREEGTLEQSYSTDELESVTLEEDSISVPIIHINRSSDTIIILGQGLPAPKEAMLAYADLFPNADILLFDYRWANQYTWYLTTSLMLCNPVKSILHDEERVVRTVVSYAQDKGYKKIVGLGVCYSAYLFAKIQADDAQAQGHGPFTHLIADSCWYSLRAFAESIKKDPFIPTSPQYGGAPRWLKILTDSCIGTIGAKLVFLCMNDVCIDQHLQRLDCPILFIHGTKDIMVPQEQFEKIWQAAPEYQRAALLTPAPHAGSQAYNAALYREIVENFITSPTLKDFLAIYCTKE